MVAGMELSVRTRPSAILLGIYLPLVLGHPSPQDSVCGLKLHLIVRVGAKMQLPQPVVRGMAHLASPGFDLQAGECL